jgi:leucyl aminopeptidase
MQGCSRIDDELSQRLTAAGKATGETVWRMPLSPGLRQDDRFEVRRHEELGRPPWRLDHRGAVPAAPCQRHVPWAHLDIAGTGMGSPSSEINRSWGSGWGVRLLDRLVAEHYEG